MEVTLNETQRQVDRQITTRLERICQSEWRAWSNLPKKKRGMLTYSGAVSDLLGARQRLYAGESPESIAHEVTTGEIQNTYLKRA